MDKPNSEMHIASLLNSIQMHEDSTALRCHIDKCPPKVLQCWKDENEYDLLHHAIIQNNVVAAATFFSRGLFKSPHTPASHPYLHLACHLGHRSLVIMLIQERANDNKPDVFQFVHASAPCSYLNGAIGSGHHDDTPKEQTPLDIAAKEGHLPCVKAILDLCQTTSEPSKTVDSYTDLACKLDSPCALRLLLSEEPAVGELQHAVALALKMAKPECLDTLLRYKINSKSVFGGMNFFHVLFTYSYSFDESWYESLVTVTAILLRHGHAVHAFRPSRTYPLYSFLGHTHLHDLERSAPFRIACLLLLLNSGADPNFDEVKIEDLINENEYETAFGRTAYPSALHCLFDTISTYVTGDCDQDVLAKYMFKCTELLLNHGADVNYIGHIREGVYGTCLHSLAHTCTHTRVPRQTLLLLLRHGADVNMKTDCLPLVAFCKVFSEGPAGTPEERAIHAPSDCKGFTPLIKAMSVDSLYETERFIRTSLDDKGSSCQNMCLSKLLSAIEAYTQRVWSLRRICSHMIWTRCRRNFQNVVHLPLPTTVKTEILAENM